MSSSVSSTRLSAKFLLQDMDFKRLRKNDLTHDLNKMVSVFGSRVIIKFKSASAMMTGYLLCADVARGENMTVLPIDQDTKRESINFVYTDAIRSVHYNEKDRIPNEKLVDLYEDPYLIVA